MKFELEKEDLYSLDITLAKVIVDALTQFKTKSGGHPASLKGEEEWLNIIQEMIDGFQIVANEEYCPPQNEEVIRQVKRAKELFMEWFNDLWY